MRVEKQYPVTREHSLGHHLEVEKFNDQIASLSQVANENCNKAKEADNRYDISVENLAKYYLLFQDSELQATIFENRSEQCKGLSALGGRSHLPDSALLMDKKYRAGYVSRQRLQLSTITMLQQKDRQFVEQGNAWDERIFAGTQRRNSHLGKSIWDCVSLLCRAKPKPLEEIYE